MIQSWNPATYVANGSFVPALGAAVLDWLAPRPGERILDLCCGDGQLTSRIVGAGATVVGVDASEAMVEGAKLGGIDARVMNVERLLFNSEFDAVFSNAAMHWVRDQDAMLAGVSRALRPGGRFVAEMGGHGNIAAIQVALAAALARRNLGGIYSAEQMNYFPSPESYRSRLEKHGFVVERIELIPRPTPLATSGMRGWLETFRRGVLQSLPEPHREAFLDETVALLEPVLRDEEGNWTADYVRLRFIARVAN